MAKTVSGRKDEHMLLCAEENVESVTSAGFEDYRFDHLPYPELSLEQIDTGLDLWQKRLSFPLLVGSITGGTERAKKINLRLAAGASAGGLGLCLGSLRIAIDDPSTLPTFDVRREYPLLPLLLGNIGAWQLVGKEGLRYIEGVGELVKKLQLDGMIVHFNPLQELIQPEGDRDFRGAIAGLNELATKLAVPIIIKEVGCGFSAAAAAQARELAIDGIEVAGRGGTDFAKIEAKRSKDISAIAVAQTFSEWGERTTDSLVNLYHVFPSLPLIASGGLRNGLDLAIALRLGASAGAMALPFLRAAVKGEREVRSLIERLKMELKTAMLLTGSPSIVHLKKAPLRRVVTYLSTEVK
jgi:isopentenyl-diphosphate Delta-isomerase